MGIRKGTAPIELWDVADIMNYLNCDEEMAKRILEDYHSEKGDGYGKVEKALILDYIERKQREQREREARYQSDLANVETAATLKEQVKTLKEQVKTLKEQIEVLRNSAESSSREAASAKQWSLVASILSILATIAAAFIPWLLNH